ncbi:MAG: orotidine-5'-phosphate decarboxylase [Thermodesulfovibrionales bacterium]|nr:orotidine-5'-phosphate decarboxylase [Thermodesulfovibrionales bacterium]
MSYRKRLIIALDVSSQEDAINIVDTLKEHVDIFKVGFELFASSGFSVIEQIHKRNKKVFLDLKFHDIPNTVSRAAASVTRLGVYMFNLHTSGGLEMMTKARESAYETAQRLNIMPPKIIGVTVLTSLSNQILKDELSITHGVKTHVKTLSGLAKKAGLDGVVASAQEISLIKKSCGSDFLVVTPGIRPSWSPPDDQKRTATPKDAIKEGADYIVMGRGILRHDDPIKAVELVSIEMLSV